MKVKDCKDYVNKSSEGALMLFVISHTYANLSIVGYFAKGSTPAGAKYSKILLYTLTK